jgi:hypothetical protein
MGYIAKSDLTEYAPSVTITDAEFTELSERASEIIDRLTLDRIPRAGGISALEADVQEAVKKAACAQLQTMLAQGGVSTVEGFGAEANTQSVTIGKFSSVRAILSGGSASTLPTVDGVPVSPMVNGYLRKTGLMYRGVG